jgi:hypothetical protein
VWTDVSAPTDVSVTPEISPPAAAGLLPSALPRVPPKRKPSRKKPPAQAEALEASQSSEPQEPASPGSEGAELAQEAMQSMMMGRGREGKASLDACLQAYPKNASCHLLFGVVLEHEGDHQGASAEFNLFLSHAPAGQPVRSTKRHFWLIEILKAHDLTIEEGREVMLWAATRTDAGWK